MKLPDIQYRRLAYKAVLALIPAVGAIASVGVLTVSQAGVIAAILGWLGSLLADRGSAQLQKDGTLILTGTVQEQVAKGTDILIADAVKSLDVLNQAGHQFDKLNQVKNQSINAVNSIPVLGPISAQILKDIFK